MGCLGTSVTITGIGFTGASSVLFGGGPATSFTVNNDNSITATVGKGLNGPISVVVAGDTLNSSQAFVMAASTTFNIFAFEPASGNVMVYDNAHTLITSVATGMSGNSGASVALFINKYGNKLYIVGGPTTYTMDVFTYKLTKTNLPTGVAIIESPDGTQLCCCQGYGTTFYMKVFDAITDTLIHSLSLGNAPNSGEVCYSKDGSKIYVSYATSGGANDNLVQTIDAKTFTIIKSFSSNYFLPTTPLVMSPDGNLLSTTRTGVGVWTYNIAKNSESVVATSNTPIAISYSSDSKTLYCIIGSSVKILNKTTTKYNVISINVANGSILATSPQLAQKLSSISLSPDGSVIYVNSITIARTYIFNSTTLDTSSFPSVISVALPILTSSNFAGNINTPCTPVITSFTPLQACPGTTVNIIGYALSEATDINIGGVPVASFTVNSDTSITAIAGTNAIGAIGITTVSGSTTSTDTIANAATSAILTVSACGSYNWHGNTYNTSGTYTFDSTNAAGCDSLITLNLTINQLVKITQQPVSTPFCSGSNIFYTLGVSDTSVTYNWQTTGLYAPNTWYDHPSGGSWDYASTFTDTVRLNGRLFKIR